MRLLNLKNVVIATEPDDVPSPPVVAASRLASAAGASLHAVFVASPRDGAEKADPLFTEPRAAMKAMFGRAGAQLEDTRLHILEGDPASAIGSLADRLHADVIVLGPHRGARTAVRVLGGTALAVVTNAACPCLVVSNSLRLPLRRVLVPVDLSDTARGALLVALSWASALRDRSRSDAERSDVALTALHVRQAKHAVGEVTPPQPIEQVLEQLRREASTWASVSIGGETTFNADVAKGIVDSVGNSAPDLIVMGTRGLGLDAVGRLGSIAASVIKTVDVPVLLVPPAVWEEHARAS
jgi:nucleotide-binding universal stress UspA family protein